MPLSDTKASKSYSEYEMGVIIRAFNNYDDCDLPNNDTNNKRIQTIDEVISRWASSARNQWNNLLTRKERMMMLASMEASHIN